jgi:hypothetical protein
VRAEHAFGAPGHHEGDPFLDLRRRQAEKRRQSRAQGTGRVLAGKIIDPAVAFGLAEDGDDIARVELALFDKGDETGNIGGPRITMRKTSVRLTSIPLFLIRGLAGHDQALEHADRVEQSHKRQRRGAVRGRQRRCFKMRGRDHDELSKLLGGAGELAGGRAQYRQRGRDFERGK